MPNARSGIVIDDRNLNNQPDAVCSQEMNRLMQTRMPSGVGGACSKPVPIPMIVM